MSAAVLLAAPAAAPATTTCDYSSSGKLLQVQLPAVEDDATLDVLAGGEIVVRPAAGSAPLPCTGTGGPPTVDNTNVIQAFNQSGNRGNLVQIRGAGDFAPGATAETAENGGTPEIEIFVNLNDAPEARLDVITSNAGGSTRFGTDGVNPNAQVVDIAPDADIFPSGIAESSMRNLGQDGPDSLGAQGGLGTGGPLTEGIELDGGASADSIVGSEGRDLLTGRGGDDSLSGMGGADNLKPGLDDDAIDGGAEADTVSYSGETFTGVTVDLALAGPQSTGGGGDDSFSSVENLIGTAHADVLRGDGGPNALFGLTDGDVLEGRGGVDVLDAGAGADTLGVRDGGPDTADCGTETDTVTADPPGIDTLIACESVLFPVTPSPSPPEPQAGDTTPSETTITEGPKDKTKKKTATFGFTSSEPGSTFQCQLDGQETFKPCTSPTTVKVKGGKHTFTVTATDASGNADPTPASESWKVKKRRGRK